MYKSDTYKVINFFKKIISVFWTINNSYLL